MKSWSRDTDSGKNREVGTLLWARAETLLATFQTIRAHTTLLFGLPRAEVRAGLSNTGKDLQVVPTTAGLARTLPAQSSNYSGGKQSSPSIITDICTDLQSNTFVVAF